MIPDRLSHTLLATLRGPAFRNVGAWSYPSVWSATNSFGSKRSYAAATEDSEVDIGKLRNIGISAHIDSGKTTLTERILYYTGRIRKMHEVRGKDAVGATMDSMDLEREKGITIQSAATFCTWKDYSINIIDTPGHVDFTIEVERALRVLDGAVLVLCGVAGVQSQSMTVDKQMKRYNVPRIAFINKLDRQGANPFRVTKQLTEKLRHNAAMIQIPIGIEENLAGVIDLVEMKALYNEGDDGSIIKEKDIPAELLSEAEERRQMLIEATANVDDHLAELFMDEAPIDAPTLRAAIRRATIARALTPVFCGSAYKNRGVQAMLDGVTAYLPSPPEVTNYGIDNDNDQQQVELSCSSSASMVALAFKLEEGPYGQLTYLRVYQGLLKRGDFIRNVNKGTKTKVARLVRMHSNEMQDIQSSTAGDIVALFGIECNSGDSFTALNASSISLTSMHVPDSVLSLAIMPQKRDGLAAFSKALQRFLREDPTFRVHTDPESGETIISGMGELHLDIYRERMLREYKVETTVGKPRVAFREAISSKAFFDYTHKKQSGGAGQYGRVVGYVEPLAEDDPDAVGPDGSTRRPFVFQNNIVGNAVPPNYIPAIQKGFEDALEKGSLVGHRIQGVRIVLTDGAAHAVDSSEMAFRIAALYAFRSCYQEAQPIVLEPVMTVEVSGPNEFQGVMIGQLNRRKGLIQDTETEEDFTTIVAKVPLNDMFGFSSDLRSSTQGKGEFSMEYCEHAPVSSSTQNELISAFQKEKDGSGSKK